MLKTLLVLAPLLAAALAWPTPAQERILLDEEWCENGGHSWTDGREAVAVCEVREFTISGHTSLDVEAGPFGGIQVQAWSRDEVRLQARVEAHASSSARARRLVDAIEIETGSTLAPRLPRTGDGTWSSVSFRLMVPRQMDLDLAAENGGISVSGVDGRIRFRTVNGGVTLAELAGDVQGRTVNGGLSVTLTGSVWAGDRLDVETVNGGMTLIIPTGYDADLETGTVNGSLRLGFPVTVQGDVSRRIRTTLGAGGRSIRVVTTNGSAVIERG